MWDQNPEVDVTGYKLSYGTASGAYSTTLDVGNVNTFVVTGLTAGQRYYFVVQAYNSSGMLSPNSAEVFFDVPSSSSPTITTLSPSSGPAGTSVTITGSNFGATQGTSAVTFNGTTATPTSWSATTIVVPVPARATTGNVVVTVGGVASNGVKFTLAVAPSITAVSPSSGSPGSSVTITGTNFGTAQGASAVTFNGTTATPTSWSATSIAVPVPPGAATGNVVVTVGGLASNGVTFTVTVAPAITSLSPSSGPPGTTVTITGADFGATQGTSTVTFNGTAGTPTSWSATRIVVPVPDNATTGNVVVTAGGASSSGVLFTVVPTNRTTTLVQHSSIDAGGTSSVLAFPADNSAGNFIVVVARAWMIGQTIAVKDTRGNTYRQAVTFANGTDDTVAIYYAQNIVAGANAVTVSVSTSASIRFAILEYAGVATSNALDVTATHTSSSASPDSGSAITTTNGDLLIGAMSTQSLRTFSAGSGYAVREAVSAAPSTALMVEDAIQAAAGPVSATAALNTSDMWGAALVAFRPLASGTAPTLTSLAPSSGPVGTAVTITGSNFGATQGASTVTFNGAAATPASWSATSIVVPVPAGATSGNVVVTVGGLASNGLPYSVTVRPTVTSVAPAAGPVGTAVTVTGTNFGATKGTSTIAFNGTTATPTSWSATSIAVPVPAGATTGNVVVTVGGLASNGVSFTVTVAPTITALSPNSGPPGTSVTITGANFGATQGASAVTFNGTAGTPSNWSATSIMVPVPANATTGNVVVTVGGKDSNGVVFTVNHPPTLAAIADQSGSENTSVSLQLVGSDPDGTAVTYTATNLPEGLVLDSNSGLISGTLTYTSAGNYFIDATVSDGTLTGDQTFTWTVTDVNRPPILGAVADQTSAPNVNVSLQLAGSDPDGTVVSYAATGLPSGVTLNASTGLISGAAATGSDGVYPVTATVSDGTLTATRTFTWTVTAATVTQSPVIDVTVWTQRSTARTTIVSPVFSTAGSNELLLALVATGYVSGENTTVTGVEGAGLTWELVGRANGQSGTSEIWRAFAAAPVAGAAVTATLSQATASMLTVMSFSNVDASGTNGAGAIGATASASRATGTPRATLITTRDNAWVFGVGNDPDAAVARTFGTSQTMIHEYLATVGNTYWVQRRTVPTALPGTSVTIRDSQPTTDRSNLFVVEILPPAATSTTALTLSPLATTATVTTTGVSSATSASVNPATPENDGLRASDYEGDRRSDLAVYDPATGLWSILLSGTNYTTSMSIVSGIAGDLPVPGDYDGDGKTDVATYRPSSGTWSVQPSSTGYTGGVSHSLGQSGDVPVPGDYDGDGKTDWAVFRPTTHEWLIVRSSTGELLTKAWGALGDLAVPGDYDHDHKTDIAVYTPSTGVWSILMSSTNFASAMTLTLGTGTDIPVPDDYDGDGVTDAAVYSPSSGTWAILESRTDNTEAVGLTLGGGEDVPIPGDYDGDGKADIAVYRTSTGTWQIIKSVDGLRMTGSWGTGSDVPLPRRP